MENTSQPNQRELVGMVRLVPFSDPNTWERLR